MIFSQFFVWSKMFPGRVGCWCCLVTVGRVVVAGVLCEGAPGAVFLGCSYSPLGAPPSHHTTYHTKPQRATLVLHGRAGQDDQIHGLHILNQLF